jgi:ubiquinone/menaquinone biosynthesis C-methylase UbiE
VPAQPGDRPAQDHPANGCARGQAHGGSGRFVRRSRLAGGEVPTRTFDQLFETGPARAHWDSLVGMDARKYHARAMSQSPRARERENESWARYWELGLLSSLGNAYSGTYEGAVRELWRNFFSALPEGGRVLDIGTGNGAIAAIAVEVARERGIAMDVHGIDLAPIRPLETVRHQRELIEPVTFHPETPAEATPFPDAHFDALTGHYAFEYTGRAACAAELGRVAADGARLQLVVHHPDSAILEIARIELGHARLLESCGFFAHGRALAERVAALPDPAARRALAGDPEAERLREALNEAAATVSAAADSAPYPDLLRLALNAFQAGWRQLVSGDPEGASRALSAGEDGIAANRARLEDLTGAFLDRVAVDESLTALTRAGFAAEPVDLVRHESGRLLGWLLRGRRNAR